MADISIAWRPEAGVGDWIFIAPVAGNLTDESGAAIGDEDGAPIDDGLFSQPGELQTGDDLFTAVCISLFTDRQADADDVIPDGSDDPRGWWGDLGADRPIGCKLWLRMRSKALPLTLALIQNDIEEALAWITDDSVASTVTVACDWIASNRLGATITITRNDGDARAIQFAWAWKDF